MNESPELLTIAELIARERGLAGVTFCGKGSFKETYRVFDKDGKACALKLADRSKIGEERTKREIAALKCCDSSRIARLFDYRVFRSLDDRTFDVVLEEYFDGGTLEDQLADRFLPKLEAIKITCGLLVATEDLRKQSLVHRDIKPANIMFRKGSDDPVLVDFGLVRDLSQTSLTATWLPHGPGTPFYSSPEQLNNDKHMIDWRSDQFSIGVTVYQSLFGSHPYQTDLSNPGSAIYAAHERKGPSDFCRQNLTSIDLTALLKMLAPWPVQRFSTPQAAIQAVKQ